jgi:hypothetical protein
MSYKALVAVGHQGRMSGLFMTYTLLFPWLYLLHTLTTTKIKVKIQLNTWHHMFNYNKIFHSHPSYTQLSWGQ